MKNLEMKKCKECGKLFQPISNKQKYCSEDHYRPCPVCGKLIFAKYLSDPARCCSGTCKSKLGKLNKDIADVKEAMEQKADIEVMKIDTLDIVEPAPEVVAYAEADAKAVEEAYEARVPEIVDPVDGTTRKRFATFSNDGWVEGHEYAVVVTQVGKEHIVKATYDYTANELVYLEYGFTNKKKISTIFKACK